MTTKTDPRIVDLEARVTVLHSRLQRLERINGVSLADPGADLAPSARPSTPPARPAPAPAQRHQPERPASPPSHTRGSAARPDLEELLGGRVLAWIGGAAVLLGLAFFFALAISRGWIGLEARCVLGGAVALGLLSAGFWLREARGRNEAAMAASAAGLAGLFLDLVVASQTYHLVAPLPALVLAMVVGTCGMLLALRWNAPVIAGIGTLGTVLAPVLAGAPPTGTTIALLWIATAAGAGVLVYKRWDLIGLAIFVAATPQWLGWLLTDGPSNATALLTLTGFGGVGLAAACGFELRSGAERLRPTAGFLMAANSLVVAIAGWSAFGGDGGHQLANAWLAALAVAHAAVGVSLRVERRISPALRTLCVAIAVILADVAWGSFANGSAVPVGWALSAIGFAFSMSRKSAERIEQQAAIVGLGGQIAIALIRVLAVDAPVGHVGDHASPDAIVALVSLAAACLVSARFADEGGLRWLLDAVGLAAVAYTTACAFDGVALVAALAAEASALAAVARARRDEVAHIGALGFLAFAALHALAIEAPPKAFLYGTEDLLTMAGALGALTVATLRIASSLDLDRGWRLSLRAGAAATTLYGASVALVTAFQPRAGAGALLADLSVHQEGQMLVSALWSITGAATLVLGLTRGKRELRLGGLAVLIASVAKVFLFDLATLTSIYRVASFIALGLILLGGAYMWQRLRPAPLPDLREA